MSVSLKKLWNDYGVGGILIAIIGLYVVSMLYKYFMSKGSSGYEGNSNQSNPAYKNGKNGKNGNGSASSSTGPQQMGPVQDSVEGNQEVFASVGGASQSMAPASSCASSSNPADLLPKDTNSQWAQLNPVGQGGLANVNFLKAGYQIGIDTVGQSLRNANLQIRSEPPNPQMSVGPWNMSTITPDFLRAPLEIGQGTQ
jgi:hypothetical protein